VIGKYFRYDFCEFRCNCYHDDAPFMSFKIIGGDYPSKQFLSHKSLVDLKAILITY
jgi:hypothetical protein